MLFHNKQHTKGLHEKDVIRFLTYLINKENFLLKTKLPLQQLFIHQISYLTTRKCDVLVFSDSLLSSIGAGAAASFLFASSCSSS
ncbi:MAG: hypothetical protein ACPHLK_00970 [Gammaproteobacteria bacterium]